MMMGIIEALGLVWCQTHTTALSIVLALDWIELNAIGLILCCDAAGWFSGVVNKTMLSRSATSSLKSAWPKINSASFLICRRGLASEINGSDVVPPATFSPDKMKEGEKR